MSIWLLILPFGALTYIMRGAFLFRVGPVFQSPGWHRWLRYVPPSVLAALVLPALVVVGQPLAPDTLSQLLAAGCAAVVAWRFQNVLATVASGMGAYWGLLWLPDLTISLSLDLLLLASAGLLLLVVGSAWTWLRLIRSTRRPEREATPPSRAVTVTPLDGRLLSSEAVSLPARKPVGAHLHCPWCWCPLPVWALYCDQCGLPQQAPAWAITQPLAAVTVKSQESERVALSGGARAERTHSLPRLVGANDARPTRSLGTASLGEKGGEHPDTNTGTMPRCLY